MQNRRDFLKSAASAAAMAGAVGAPQFSFAQQAGGKTFIKVFMYGGADGLHLFPMLGDMSYYTYRPNLAIEPPSNDINSAIDLGLPMRAMNPNLEPLMEIWDAGRMMIAPSTSFAPNNRSHFDCQRWVGTGITRNDFADGFLNRYMQSVTGADHTLRGLKANSSLGMNGAFPVPTVSNAGTFDIRNRFLCEGQGCADNRMVERLREIHAQTAGLSPAEIAIRDDQATMIDAIENIKTVVDNYTPSAGGLDYSNSSMGRALRLCAQLLKGGIPLEVASVQWNGDWDSHSTQIADGTNRFTDQGFGYHRNLASGASDLLCFYRDMGAMMDDVVVLVGSEFGRTKYENGSNGTDHGEGGAWFAFGGPTQRAIAPDVSTIDDSVIPRNWLPTVTNYRNIMGEIMVRHMGMPENLVSTIFPGHSFENYRLFDGVT